MSQNPFRTTGTPNLHDIPMQEAARAKAQAGGSQAVGSDVVTMSLDGKNTNPAGKAFLDHLIGAVRVAMNSREKAMADVLADQLAPALNRIEALEVAIDVQRQEVQDAIRTASAGFLGETEEDSDTPTMEELTRQHKQHMKTMEVRRNEA